MSKEERDPEVEADLRLRASTEHDHTRARGPAPMFGAPKFAAEWPCRAKCGAMVQVTEAAVETWRMFNSTLRKRGEEPIEAEKIVFCTPCRTTGTTMRPDGLRKQVDSMAEVIRKLKNGGSAEEERTWMKQLEKGGHPDVGGLIASIAERKLSVRGKKLREY